MCITMIKKRKKIIIDLTSPEGNAYSMMLQAKSLCKQLGIDHKPILKEMKSGDYENLINVFEREFGDYVDLYR